MVPLPSQRPKFHNVLRVEKRCFTSNILLCTMYIFGIKYPAQKETERFLIFVVCCFFPHHVIFDNVCIRATGSGRSERLGQQRLPLLCWIFPSAFFRHVLHTVLRRLMAITIFLILPLSSLRQLTKGWYRHTISSWALPAIMRTCALFFLSIFSVPIHGHGKARRKKNEYFTVRLNVRGGGGQPPWPWP